MKTYQDFKRKDEAVETANPSQDIERQIDALFDELKKKVRDLENPQPRQSYADMVKTWMARPRAERERIAAGLESYNYLRQFQEALAVNDIDTVLDEYREKLKQMVRTYAASMAVPQAAPQAAAPQQVTPAAEPQVQPQPKPKPKRQPKPVEKSVETPPQQATIPPVEAAPQKTVPPVPKPKEEPPATQAKPTPKAEIPPVQEKPQEDPARDNKIRKGYAVLLARSVLDTKDVSQEDIDYVMSQPFDHKYHANEKECLKAYDEFEASQKAAPPAGKDKIDAAPEPAAQNKGPIPDTPEPVNPMTEKGWAKTKSELKDMSDEEFKAFVMDNDPDGIPIMLGHYDGENSPTAWWHQVHRQEAINELPADLIKKKKKVPSPPPPSDGSLPTREQLMAMTPQKFKQFLLSHDTDLAKSYEGQPWENRSFRPEIVDSLLHFWQLQDDKENASINQMPMESLKHRVNKYKEMLRQDNRPELLLHEAAKVPFNERVSFYKKKLRSSSFV